LIIPNLKQILDLLDINQDKNLSSELCGILRIRNKISVPKTSELNKTMLLKSHENRHSLHPKIKMNQDLRRSY